VNNTVYFRWFETARIEYMHRVNFDDWLPNKGIGPILAAIRCQYRRPIVYPDQVLIGTRITRLGRSSIDMEHRLWSEAQQLVAAEGDSTIVVYDYRQSLPTPIPPEVRHAIEQIEGRTF
jgi:acyl-CoA thioester hydrolase